MKIIFSALVFVCLLCSDCSVSALDNTIDFSRGQCQDIMINVAADKPGQCPHFRHFSAAEIDRTDDGTTIGYICVCER